MGFPINIISQLEKDNQIVNIEYDENKNIKAKPEFLTYRETLDEFLKFQIDKFI